MLCSVDVGSGRCGLEAREVICELGSARPYGSDPRKWAAAGWIQAQVKSVCQERAVDLVIKFDHCV